MGASSYRLLDAAHSNTIEDFLQHSRRRSKKTAQSWRVSGGLSALPHEPAQTTEAGKTKTESKPQTRKTYASHTIQKQLNHQPTRNYTAVGKFKSHLRTSHETFALAGDRHSWFNTHFQPSGCFSCSAGIRSVRCHSKRYPDR